MCYAKPGPRCANSVRRELDSAARKVVRLEITSGTPGEKIENAKAALLTKLHEYDATTGGQEDLRNQIADEKKNGLTPRLKVLENRLQKGTEAYQSALDEYKVAQRAKKIVEAHKPQQLSPRGISMKDMDALMLSMALRQETAKMDAESRQMLESSVQLASHLHRADTRKMPTRNSQGDLNQPTSPYIEHPLRNTLRAARWGVHDGPTLAAIALHDTVEDHHRDIVRDNVGIDPSSLSEEKSREMAYSYITSIYGQETSDLVRAVSNPVMDVNLYSREQREQKYAEHVEREVMESPKTLVIKFSDFTDNALSAHHHEIDYSAYKRARKYLKVCDTFRIAAQHHDEALTSLMSPAGKQDMINKINGSEAYLRKIMRTYEEKEAAEKAAKAAKAKVSA